MTYVGPSPRLREAIHDLVGAAMAWYNGRSVDDRHPSNVTHERAVALDRLLRDEPTGDVEEVDVVFEGDGPDLRFVEVHGEDGASIRVGEWLDVDGYRVLRLRIVR